MDGNGRVLAKAECPTDVPAGFDHAMRRVIEMLAQSATSPGLNYRELGLGAPGRWIRSRAHWAM